MSASPPNPTFPAESHPILPPSASQTANPRAKPRKQRCENCRSKRLFIQDGRLWCRRCGTLQEDFVQTQQEDDFGTLRSSQVTRQKKESKEKVKKHLTGIKALCLYMSIYQLILQHLCRALIDGKGLPATLETIVKGLWELRIKLIYQRYLATQPRDLDDDEFSHNTLYSSQTETEYSQTDVEETTDASEGLPTKVRHERDFPNVIDMLALCHMGCMVLRVPLSIGTLSGWAIREEIPHLWPLRLVPPEMQQRLSHRWLVFLQTRAALRPSKLYMALHDLIALYSRHFAIDLPPLNYPPLLHHYMITLSLPIDLFPAVSHLSTILGKPFAFPKPRRQATFIFLPEAQLLAYIVIATKIYHPFRRPSTAGFSPTSSTINATSGPGLLPLDWSSWLSAQQEVSRASEPSKPYAPGEQLNISSKDIFSLTPEQLDSYMDWFEETWTDTAQRRTGGNESTSGEEIDTGGENQSGVLGEIVAMFSASRHPLHRPSSTDAPSDTTADPGSHDATLIKCGGQAIMKIQSSVSTPNPLPNQAHSPHGPHLPGEHYIHYRFPADLGEKDNIARIFHERAAEMAGLQLADLLKAVYKMERRLIRWWAKEGARRRARDDGDGDGDEAMAEWLNE